MANLPTTCLPDWEVADLPEPKRLGLRNLTGFIGPGIVMCGIQIGGGEWLFGPAITARYGGGLMWIATVAIVVQVFYNIECGRYALYCGEPVFTGFMRTRPGPAFWVGVTMLVSVGALIPGLSTNAAVLIVSMKLDRPPTAVNLAVGDELRVITEQVMGETGSFAAEPGSEIEWLNRDGQLVIRTTSQRTISGGDGAATDVMLDANRRTVTLSGAAPPGAIVRLSRITGGAVYDQEVRPVTTTADQSGRWTLAMQDDSFLVNTVAYLCLAGIILPVLLGGKVYNMLQVVMTAKVFLVLGFCLIIGLFFVGGQGWYDVFSGFLKFGNVPIADGEGGETVVNAFTHYFEHGEWPVVALTNIALLGAFAGYAGGGGLSNATYSNFVRDKGWGMGSQVGAIASAVGGRNVTLSHVGKVFLINEENLRRWRGWWKYVITDQVFIWGPGCFMGMALPALISIQFAHNSPMFGLDGVSYAQPLIAADGIRHAANFGGVTTQVLWLVTLFIGLMVFLPSQMSIVDDFARRWTDIIWSGNRRVRESMNTHQVKYVFYTIIAIYVVWSFISATIFLKFGNAPTLMVTVIANLNNVAIGFTAFHVLWINRNFLPKELQPKWYSQVGIACCGTFYLGLATLVFFAKVLPLLTG